MTESPRRKGLLAILSFTAVVAALILWAAWGDGDAEPGAGPGTVAKRVDETVGPEGAVKARDADPGPVPDDMVRHEATPVTAESGAPRILLRGRLVDRAGRPQPEQEVILTERDSSGFEMGIPRSRPGEDDRARTTTDGDGRFSFPLAAGVGGSVILGGSEMVLVDGPVEFSGSERDIDLGDRTALVAGVLAGVVQDAAGRGVEGVIVSASPGGGLGLSLNRYSSTTDSEGRFRVGGLSPGAVHLRTASPRFLPHESELQLTEEEQRLDLVLQVRQGRAIAGQVIDDLGRPVAGIQVGAQRRTERGSLSVERFTPDEATETDGNGLFTLAGLAGEAVTVRASGDGFEAAVEADVAVGTGNLLLRMQRLGAVTGVLRGDDGAPLVGSRVVAQAGESGVLFMGSDSALPVFRANEGRTAADGSFRVEGVAPGVVTVRASGDSHRPVEREGVHVAPGETTRGIELIARLGSAVRVTVLDAAGQPVGGAEVHVTEQVTPGAQGSDGVRMRAMRIEDDNGNRRILDSSDAEVYGRGTTGDDGVAVIGGLPAGVATVGARHDELADSKSVDVVLPEVGEVEAALRMRPAGFVEVASLDAQRQPAPGARFVVTGPHGNGAQPGEQSERTDDQGRARVGPLLPGTYRAELQLDPPGRDIGGGTFVVHGDEGRRLARTGVDFVVRAGETESVELIKPVLTTVTGTVTDAQGPVAGVMVSLSIQEEEEVEIPGMEGGWSDRTGADGRFRVTDLPAGKYRLSFGKPEQIVKARQELELLPGEAERIVDLRLRGGIVKIVVTSAEDGEPIEGADVQVLRGDGGGDGQQRPRRMMMISITANSDGGGEATRMTFGANQVKTDVDGEAVIPDVPPGTWRVRVRDDKYVARTLTDQVVTDGGILDCGTLSLDPAARLRGTVAELAGGGMMAIAIVEYWLVGNDGNVETQPAPGGAFQLTGLKPGRYKMRAREASGEDWGPELEVEVKAGRNPAVELRLK